MKRCKHDWDSSGFPSHVCRKCGKRKETKILSLPKGVAKAVMEMKYHTFCNDPLIRVAKDKSHILVIGADGRERRGKVTREELPDLEGMKRYRIKIEWEPA